ncbi:hypothetical protein AMECASPLE_025920 [Ameca splendens]|uniref:Uncharacterized protein n=1 Tax=Ameca splendens TaxID=208324 RepID=A0ABV0ZDS5_9TELE
MEDTRKVICVSETEKQSGEPAGEDALVEDQNKQRAVGPPREVRGSDMCVQTQSDNSKMHRQSQVCTATKDALFSKKTTHSAVHPL